MLAQLTDGELDVALGPFADAPPDIQVQTLFEERFVSLADKTTLPNAGALSLNAWLARPHVMLALRPDAHDEIEQALAARGLHRRVALVLPHWGAALDVVAGTDLILTVASRSVGSLRRFPGLHKFTPPLPLPPFAFQQAWHARRDGDPMHRWLRDAIAACCAAT